MVAYYARQSKEKPNDTIENQFAIIDSYISKQADLSGAEVLRLSDNGFTGLNIERDAFRELLGLVRERKINTVAVKDFSRLGRNYLDVIKLTESIFPFMGVRVIAVSDNYDSKYSSKSEPVDLLVSLKAILNEIHVIDMSDKLRKSIAQRTKDGKFYGNIAYGYMLADLKTPVINESQAEIVREIFDAYLAGKSIHKIAGELNERGLRTGRNKPWTVQMVRRLLGNAQYIGKKEGLTHHRDPKTRKWSGTPEAGHYTKEDAFPPIVERDVFERVQALLPPKKSRNRSENHHIMSRKLFCAHCGRTLSHQKSFSCRTGYYQGGSPCFEGLVKPSALYPQVLDKVRIYIGEDLARFDCYSPASVKKAEAEISALKEKTARIYEAYLTHTINEQEFIRRKRVISDTFEKASAHLDELREHEAMFAKTGKTERPIDTLRRLHEAQTLTAGHMQFVKRINVHSPEQFDILLRDESPLGVLCRDVPLWDEN